MAGDSNAVAVFDFDGTLTVRDTLLPFLIFSFGWLSLIRRSLVLVPTLSAYTLGLINNSVAKERVVRVLFGSMPGERFSELARRFAVEKLPQLVDAKALARLVWHQQQGHRCIIASASIEDYLRPWAQDNGVTDVLATQLLRDHAGAIDGHFVGGNCYGKAKVDRLSALLGNLETFDIYAYGDSRGDRELLAVATHGYYRSMPEFDND